MKQKPGLTALLVALTFVFYLPALSGGFIWDDDAYVTNNPMLADANGWRQIWFSGHHQSQYFPLVYTVLRIEYLLWGLDAGGYHLVNVLFHCANALLVWRILDHLKIPGAWLAAAFFAVHPVQVESVAWITELKNTQSTLLYLLALLMWLSFLEPNPSGRKRYYLWSMGFYLLALLSKTTACTLPAALLLVVWIKKESVNWRRILQVVPFVALGIGAGLFSIWWESHLGNYKQEVGQTLTWLQRTLLAAHNLWFYAGKLAWPYPLTFSYPKWQPDVTRAICWTGLAALLALGACLWHSRDRIGRPAVAAVLFFVAALSPLLGFIPLFTFKYTYVADHYQYVACIGLLAVLAAVLNRFHRAVGGVFIAVFGLLTWNQSEVYHDAKTVWLDTIAKNPSSWVAHQNVAALLVQNGELEEGIMHLHEMIRINPGEVEGYYNLGTALGMSGRLDEAANQFEQVLRLNPKHSKAHCNLGVALEREGRLEEAISHFEEALRLDPDNGDARDNLNEALSHRVSKGPRQ
jgi:tetratricopeptide (TPR) repeat protein